MNVLLLTASTGGGHTKAAEAVMESMKLQFPDSKILLVDCLKYISPIVDRLIAGFYDNAIRKTPHIYGSLYRLTETSNKITAMTEILKILSYRLCSLIKKYGPSVIICTHTFPLQMVSNLKRKGLITIPIMGIVTDFTNHSYWNLKHVDAFIVAHDNIKSEMTKIGMPKESIFTYGIPVLRSFLLKKDRKDLLNEFGLTDKFTILLMGGSLGVSDVRGVFLSLLQSRRDIQIIVVTGRNHKLEKQLSEMKHLKKGIKIFGYTDRISDLMDISNVIITKPGGISISEALVKGLPILLMSPIPGQEKRNASFLINKGASVQLPLKEDIDIVFQTVVDNPLNYQKMKDIAESLAKPLAADAISLLAAKLSVNKYFYTPKFTSK